MDDLREEVIEVKIKPDGEIIYTVKGVKGSSCKDLTRFLDELGEAKLDSHTGEFFDFEESVKVTL